MSKKVAIKIKEKRYFDEPKIHALAEIEIEIKENEAVSIIGPNGCGKSTLLKLILGIDQEFSGEIRVGQRIVKKPYNDCGIVFQEPRLLPWLTVEKNITFGAFVEADKRRGSELLNLLKSDTPAKGGGLMSGIA